MSAGDPSPAAASSGGAFIAAGWPAPAGVEAGSTLRSAVVGGRLQQDFSASLRHAGDRPEAAARSELLQQFAGLPGRPLGLKQVHGSRVVEASEDRRGAAADGLWTREENLVLAIETADCMPLLLADDDGTVIAALHAGWRGLASGIVDAALEALPCRPQKLRAWIGPAISQQHYEVGSEVRQAFLERDARLESFFLPSPPKTAEADASPGPRWLADLPGMAAHQLRQLGLTQIYNCGLCTFAHPELFFSYRRGDRHKFIVTLIWRQPAPRPRGRPSPIEPAPLPALRKQFLAGALPAPPEPQHSGPQDQGQQQQFGPADGPDAAGADSYCFFLQARRPPQIHCRSHLAAAGPDLEPGPPNRAGSASGSTEAVPGGRAACASGATT